MGIKLRYWFIGIIIIALSVAAGLKYQLNPYNTASDTFRGRVLGFEIFRIPSGSMQPTLVPGDNIFVSTRIYQDQEPQTNDVIIFLYPKNKEVNYFYKEDYEDILLKNWVNNIDSAEIQSEFSTNTSCIDSKKYKSYKLI